MVIRYRGEHRVRRSPLHLAKVVARAAQTCQTCSSMRVGPVPDRVMVTDEKAVMDDVTRLCREARERLGQTGSFRLRVLLGMVLAELGVVTSGVPSRATAPPPDTPDSQ